MKVAPVSADLLIKLGLGAAVLGGLWYGARKLNAALPSVGGMVDTAAQAASDAIDWAAAAAASAADAVNPLNDNNLAARAANAGATAAAGYETNAGGWLYDIFHKPVFVGTVPPLDARPGT